MQTREIVGLCLIPIALLITAGTLNVAGVGSVVWFGAMLASAILILALVSFCFGVSPSTVPFNSLLMVYVASVVILFLGMIIRISFYEEIVSPLRQFDFGGRQKPTNWTFVVVSSLYEWVLFRHPGVRILTVRRIGQAEPGQQLLNAGQPIPPLPEVPHGAFRS